MEKTRILIVDDDDGITETLPDILEMKGYEADVAEDGQMAIEMVKVRPYDIAFIDIRMPGINGVETFKKIKHISPKTAVMMITAYSVDELAREALEEGACGIINKPLDIDRMLGFIGEAKKKA